MRYRYFDSNLRELANKCLLEAEELVAKNEGISKKIWDRDYKQVLFPMKREDLRDLIEMNCFGAIFKSIPALERIKTEIIADDREIIPEKPKPIESRGQKARRYTIKLNEHYLSEYKNNEDDFLKITKYVLVHELLHMLKSIKIDKLKREWMKEDKTHELTRRIVGYNIYKLYPRGDDNGEY